MLILQKSGTVIGARVRSTMFYQSCIGFLAGIPASSLESFFDILINVFWTD